MAGSRYTNSIYISVAILLIFAGFVHLLSENKHKSQPATKARTTAKGDRTQKQVLSPVSHIDPIQKAISHPEDSSDLSSTSNVLAIDENSTIASDIVKIWHDIDAKAICVALTETARCPRPAFLGRLSGPALAILEWKERQSDAGTVSCGEYGHHWLDAGAYFVEIIILHCKDFGIQALQRAGTDNKMEWLEADHRHDCVEDANHNRITSSREEHTTIQVSTHIEGNESYRYGRWIRNRNVRLRQLFTRYQPVECFVEEPAVGTPMREHCNFAMDRDNDGKKKGENVTGLYEYRFEWNMKKSEERLLEKLRRRLREQSIPKICAVGDSHSEYMVKGSLPILDLVGLFDFVRSPWIAPNGIGKKIAGRNCDVFFIQVGQWPASKHTRERPFSFGKYHDKLKQLVQNILQLNPDAMVYLPTIDQAPLMALVNSCYDWRTPTMLDGYSLVNQMIVQDLNMPDQVKYIDTNFIIYTHWDGHEDWQHLMEIVRSRKTLYVAAVMLGETQWFGG